MKVKIKDNFQARVAELLGIEQETYSKALITAKQELSCLNKKKDLKI